MTGAEVYAAKKAKGHCIAGGCSDPAVKGVLCPAHQEKFRQAQRVEERHRKSVGQCRRCQDEVFPDSAYCLRHVDDYKQRQKTSLAALKLETMEAYGGAKCKCCGESRMCMLALDHLNNDGNKHRKEVKAQGCVMYRWAKNHGWPPLFQVLCFNCNQAKRIMGECPHITERRNAEAYAQ